MFDCEYIAWLQGQRINNTSGFIGVEDKGYIVDLNSASPSQLSDCLAINFNGTLTDGKCSVGKPYICEYNALEGKINQW